MIPKSEKSYKSILNGCLRMSNRVLFISILNLFIYFLSGNTTFCRNILNEENDSLIQTNHIFQKTIKTVELFKDGWPLSYPIMDLNATNKLKLKFDELGDQVGDYYYTFIHCDADWNFSALNEADYLDGFPENQLNHFEYSFNTTVKYVHYELVFPNDDVRFLVSGNYILLVYRDYNRNEPVLTRRFMITENRLSVRGVLKRAATAKSFDTGQELEITVGYPGFPISDPYHELMLVVSKNGRWDNAIVFRNPNFVRNKEVVYSFDQKNIFPGGNEYRYFDIKSIRYQSQYVKFIDFKSPFYYVGLYPSKPRFNKAYFYEQDMNGKFIIKIQEGKNSDTEADYVKVYFTLQNPFPITEGEIYIFGAISDWSCTPDNHLIYNYETKAYESSLTLKQGVYNYQYVVKRKNTGRIDPVFIEGSYYETENDYLIYVYYRAPGSRYDRLAGMQMLNSLHKPK